MIIKKLKITGLKLFIILSIVSAIALASVLNIYNFGKNPVVYAASPYSGSCTIVNKIYNMAVGHFIYPVKANIESSSIFEDSFVYKYLYTSCPMKNTSKRPYFYKYGSNGDFSLKGNNQAAAGKFYLSDRTNRNDSSEVVVDGYEALTSGDYGLSLKIDKEPWLLFSTSTSLFATSTQTTNIKVGDMISKDASSNDYRKWVKGPGVAQCRLSSSNTSDSYVSFGGWGGINCSLNDTDESCKAKNNKTGWDPLTCDYYKAGLSCWNVCDEYGTCTPPVCLPETPTEECPTCQPPCIRSHQECTPICSQNIFNCHIGYAVGWEPAVSIPPTPASVPALTFPAPTPIFSEPAPGGLDQVIINKPNGYHDRSGCDYSWGWACDADDYSEALEIHFYARGSDGSIAFLGSTIANQPGEPGIGARCGGQLAHRFVFPTPHSIKNSKDYTIYAYAINVGSGTVNPLLGSSPRTIFSCVK